jgi:hypothetical protein
MWVSHHVKSTAGAERSAPFHCEACGLHGLATAEGEGDGEGTAVYFIGRGAAARRSEAEALGNAERDAALLLKLVPCPRCGKRNPIHARRFMQRAAMRCLSATPLTIAVYALGIAYHVTAIALFGLFFIAGSLI